MTDCFKHIRVKALLLFPLKFPIKRINPPRNLPALSYTKNTPTNHFSGQIKSRLKQICLQTASFRCYSNKTDLKIPQIFQQNQPTRVRHIAMRFQTHCRLLFLFRHQSYARNLGNPLLRQAVFMAQFLQVVWRVINVLTVMQEVFEYIARF